MLVTHWANTGLTSPSWPGPYVLRPGEGGLGLVPGRRPHWVAGCSTSAPSGDSEESTRKGCRPTSSQAPLPGPGE